MIGNHASSWPKPLSIPLVFLPGHMCDVRGWSTVAEHLASRGHRIVHVALDSDDSVDAMAARILSEQQGDFVAIGFSMGAIVALALHRAAPNRIAGLCLVGINAGPDLAERAAPRLLQQEAVRAGRLTQVVREQLLPHYFAARSPDAARLGALCVDMAEAIGPEAFVRQSEALRLRLDGRPGLATIKCPTLVIGADEDRLCPPDWHVQTAAAISGAQLAIIEGAGHMALLEKSAAMATVVGAWLDQHGGTWQA